MILPFSADCAGLVVEPFFGFVIFIHWLNKRLLQKTNSSVSMHWFRKRGLAEFGTVLLYISLNIPKLKLRDAALRQTKISLGLESWYNYKEIPLLPQNGLNLEHKPLRWHTAAGISSKITLNTYSSFPAILSAIA